MGVQFYLEKAGVDVSLYSTQSEHLIPPVY